jgi:predicted amidohydrolase YtcJ
MNKQITHIAGSVWTGQGIVLECLIRVENQRIFSIEPKPTGALPKNTHELAKHQLLIPGFHDAHLHLCMGGLMLNWADFDGVDSADAFEARLKEYIAKTDLGPKDWIEGRGLDETKVQITREDIDRICDDRPVFIWTHDLHSAIANSAALTIAGIYSDMKDPAGGRFERDSSRVVNGVLRENAAYLVNKFVPLPSAERGANALRQAQEKAFSLGITAASASVRPEYMQGYQQFVGSSEHKIRLNIWRTSANFDFEADRFIPKRSDRFRMATLKGFADGALGSRSAAFFQPYADDPENSGICQTREGPLARYIRSAHGVGLQVALHAIGDRANCICLDAFEMAGCQMWDSGPRPRIEHCQVLRQRDIGRFAELGVIASMQPVHCIADMPFIEKRIGAERCKYAYAWKSLKKSGAVLAFGSDWPVEEVNPILGLHAATTRLNPGGWPRGGWQAQECLAIDDALDAYTRGSAYAAHWDREMGTIEQGKWADFAVLSKNVLEVPANEILNTKVDMTMVGGEVVWERERRKDKSEWGIEL